MKYGYVRSFVQSTEHIDQQIKLLKKFNIDEYIVEKTGHDLEDLLRKLQSGDMLHVVSIDRLSRNPETCNKIVADLLLNNITVYVAGYPVWFRGAL